MSRAIALDATYSLARQPRGVAVYSAQLIEWMRGWRRTALSALLSLESYFPGVKCAPKTSNASRRLLSEKLCFPLAESRVRLFMDLARPAALPLSSYGHDVSRYLADDRRIFFSGVPAAHGAPAGGRRRSIRSYYCRFALHS